MLKVNVDTLHDRAVRHYDASFSDIYKKFTESGKCSIRRYQFAHMPKNASMCMYLGKVYLGQKDTPDNMTPPNDQINETLREQNKRIGELLEENQRLKANANVGQAASQHPSGE